VSGGRASPGPLRAAQDRLAVVPGLGLGLRAVIVAANMATVVTRITAWTAMSNHEVTFSIT